MKRRPYPALWPLSVSLVWTQVYANGGTDGGKLSTAAETRWSLLLQKIHNITKWVLKKAIFNMDRRKRILITCMMKESGSTRTHSAACPISWALFLPSDNLDAGNGCWVALSCYICADLFWALQISLPAGSRMCHCSCSKAFRKGRDLHLHSILICMVGKFWFAYIPPSGRHANKNAPHKYQSIFNFGWLDSKSTTQCANAGTEDISKSFWLINHRLLELWIDSNK